MSSEEEAAQQAKLASKYGGLPSKKGILNKRMKGQTERTFFDSADHFSGKETGNAQKQPSPSATVPSTSTTTLETTTSGTSTSGGGGGSSTAGVSAGTGGTSSGGGGDASSTEATQTAKLSNKYGGLPNKKGILNKRMKGQNERTYFDSADHFSGKETGSQTKSPLKGNPALGHLKK
jgi:hypothetical protein